MRGVCRLLWSAILLVSLGCQSMPQGSTGLAGRLSDALKAPARQPGQGEGLAGLIASRRSTGPDRQSSRQQQNQQAQQTPALPGRWAEDEVLQMVVEQELEDATPQEREALMQRLANSSEDEVADVLIERRQALQTAATSRPATSEQIAADPSVQQIILTRQPEADAPSEQMQAASFAGHSGRQPDQTRAAHPLAGDSARLAAPTPGGGRRPPPQRAEEVRKVSQDEPPPVAIDAFGAGGELLAARHQIAESSRIGLAGGSTIEEPDTQAEAIARELDSDTLAQSVYWQEDLDKLITLLEAQVAQQKPGTSDGSRDQYIRQHVALRMLYLIASRQPEALQAIPAVSHDRQEFWTRMFWALASIFDEEAMPNSTVRAAETVAQLRGAIEQLQPRASLELRGSVFCRRIDGFGNFVTFDDEPFAPGQPVLIYTEVRNFQSQSAEDGGYRTVLRSSITIQQGSVSGPVVFKYDLPATEDRCQSRRQDYFHSYRIHLPETLKPGPYVLTLDVTDALTGKNGSTLLNFVVR